MVERLAVVAEDVAAVAAQVRALVPAPALGRTTVVAGIIASVREGGDAALLDARAALRRRRRRRCACPRDELDAALDALDPDVRAGLELALANVRARRARRASGEDRDVALPQGQRVRLRELPGRAAPRSTRPAAARRTRRSVVMGVVTARAAGVARGRRRRARAPGDPRRLRAVRRRRGLPHGRRPGDRRARLRDGDDPARRRDRRPGQPVRAGGQAPGLGPRRDRRLRRARRDLLVLALRRRRPAPGRARPARPGRARRRLARRRGLRRRARCSTRSRASSRRSSATAADRRRRAEGARRRRPTSRPRSPSPRRSRPSTSQLVGEAAEALAPRVTRAGCLFVGRRERDGVRRLRRGLEPHAADRRRGALRLRPHRRRTSAAA